MSGNHRISVRRVTVGLGCIAAVVSLAVMPLQSASHDAKGQANSVCPGFVVLKNGYAVLSETRQNRQAGNAHDHGGHQMDKAANKGHDHGGHQMGKAANKGHDHGGHKGGATTHQDHLMGYQHGEAIAVGKGGLCVPLSSPGDTAWMAVSQNNGLAVAVESLRGALAHNSRANEGFGITIVGPGEVPLANANVHVFARMPHHDHRMPGGHGPANDPDVQGLAVRVDDQGQYRVNTVDFSMPGPWLLEVRVKNGGETFKAYFAPNVGEE